MKTRYLSLIFTLAAILAALISHSGQANAQTIREPTSLQGVKLWINPEYDDPRLLVMLEGKISGTQAPALVKFLVPSEAAMYSAGSKDAQDKYSGGPPNRIPSEIPGWDEISYLLQTDTFRVEYYDPVILAQPDKKISYDFRWLYPINDLSVIVQQPKKSSDYTIKPSGRSTTDGEGFSVQTYSYRNLGIKDPAIHFDISYTKTDPDPSINPVGSGSSRSGLVIALVVGVIVVGLFIWIINSQRKPASTQKYQQRAGQTRAARRRNARNRVCSHCGQPIDKPSQFCPNCGGKFNKIK